MKKFLLALAATGMVLTGCTQSEIIEEGPVAQTGRIGFASHVNKGTRALDNENFASFQVYGAYTMPNETNSPVVVFNDVKVSKGENAWTYDDLRYWVPKASYRFSAYSSEGGLPTGARANYAEDVNHVYQLNLVDYRSDKDNQRDLIYASAGPIVGKDKENATVPMEFGHILSRVQMQFKSSFPAGYQVEVSNVRINNIRNKGNFMGSTETWTEVNRTADDMTVEPKFSAGNNICKAKNGEEEAVNALTEFAYVIPFEYQLNNVDFIFDIKVTNGGVTIMERQLRAAWKPNWKKNQQYRYTVTLTGSEAGLEPIKFTGSVSEWDALQDENAGTISGGELPQN